MKKAIAILCLVALAVLVAMGMGSSEAFAEGQNKPAPAISFMRTHDTDAGHMDGAHKHGKPDAPRLRENGFGFGFGFGDKDGEHRVPGFGMRQPDLSKYEGMTDEERIAAIKEDFRSILEEKVASGEMTREQADLCLEKFATGPCGEPGFGFGFRFGAKDGKHMGLGFGMRPPDLSKYEGMTDEERAAAIKEDLQSILEEKVADGKMTQEQADRILENFRLFPKEPDFPGKFRPPLGKNEEEGFMNRFRQPSRPTATRGMSV